MVKVRLSGGDYEDSRQSNKPRKKSSDSMHYKSVGSVVEYQAKKSWMVMMTKVSKEP